MGDPRQNNISRAPPRTPKGMRHKAASLGTGKTARATYFSVRVRIEPRQWDADCKLRLHILRNHLRDLPRFGIVAEAAKRLPDEP